jgi:broad specificity phosphatase PhoE
MAAEHHTVLVVGHGMFNRFVATCLRNHGWHGPRMLPTAYWATAKFVRTERSV